MANKEIIPLTEQECYVLIAERFGDVKNSVESRNKYSDDVFENDCLIDAERYERDSDEYISEQMDAGDVASLKNYYAELSDKNLQAVKSDLGGYMHPVYSPLGIDYFFRLLDKPERTEQEEYMYNLIMLQARIFKTPDCVWEGVLEDSKEDFAWVKDAPVYDCNLYRSSTVLCYNGTVEVSKGIVDGYVEKLIIEFLKENEVPKPEEYVKQWANDFIFFLAYNTPSFLNFTSTIGLQVYETDYLKNKSLDGFVAHVFSDIIQIAETKDSYFIRLFSIWDDGLAPDCPENFVSDTFFELSSYLLSRNQAAIKIDEKIRSIETMASYFDLRFELGKLLDFFCETNT
ncbi:MAG: hypothetical protein U9P44_03225 [archaeon]|nr:hypothetical protein [archaeon]